MRIKCKAHLAENIPWGVPNTKHIQQRMVRKAYQTQNTFSREWSVRHTKHKTHLAENIPWGVGADSSCPNINETIM